MRSGLLPLAVVSATVIELMTAAVDSIRTAFWSNLPLRHCGRVTLAAAAAGRPRISVARASIEAHRLLDQKRWVGLAVSTCKLREVAGGGWRVHAAQLQCS